MIIHERFFAFSAKGVLHIAKTFERVNG